MERLYSLEANTSRGHSKLYYNSRQLNLQASSDTRCENSKISDNNPAYFSRNTGNFSGLQLKQYGSNEKIVNRNKLNGYLPLGNYRMRTEISAATTYNDNLFFHSKFFTGVCQ